MGKTTVKAVSLAYGTTGGNATTKLMGVLKGLSIGQDAPESTEIEAEFYDSPFDIFYDGNPVTMTFELANYELSELPALFGGTYDPGTQTYEGAANAFTSEHAWQLNFGRGHAALYIYKGLTIGTIKKDADGALNYSVTITALVYTTGEGNEAIDHMYKIIGTSGNVTWNSSTQPKSNPKAEGFYEKDGSNDSYRPTWDTTVVDSKTYYKPVTA